MGSWENGVKQGLGMYIDPIGVKYEGEWKEGKQSGVGVRMQPSGEKYAGDMLADQKHGFGVWVHPGGVTYKGVPSSCFFAMLLDKGADVFFCGLSLSLCST